MICREIGPIREYPTGAVYLGDRVIGHRVCPGALALSCRGDKCGPGWRIERNLAACREYDHMKGT